MRSTLSVWQFSAEVIIAQESLEAIAHWLSGQQESRGVIMGVV